MLEFFQMAEATRDPRLRDRPISELMREAAIEAGWHLEYVENLQNKNKYQVRYTKPFSSKVTAELVCRYKPQILATLKTIHLETLSSMDIDSFLGYGVFNFIKSYKPDVHNTDSKIVAALTNSIKIKFWQLGRKEVFRFVPGYVGNKNQKGEVVREIRYKNTPRTVSYNSPAFNDMDSEAEMGDFIPDTSPSPEDRYIEKEDIEEFPLTYGQNKEIEKVIISIMVEAGSHGKITIRDLQRDVVDRLGDLIQELTEEKDLVDKRRKGGYDGDPLEREYQELLDRIHNLEVIVNKGVNSINRQVKLFYRRVKEALAKKYHIG